MMGFDQSKIKFFYFNRIFSCRLFHCAPNVPHYAKNKAVGVMKPGHCFTIEPMINAGKRHTRLNAKDGWTVTTRDGRLSAQWEHTLCVTNDGCDILTQRSDEPGAG